MSEINYTYMLRCADGSLYTGWSNHLKKRVEAHQQGKGGKYTRSRLPVELVYFETFTTKEEAMQREYAIKQLTRIQKLKLVETAQYDKVQSDLFRQCNEACSIS